VTVLASERKALAFGVRQRSAAFPLEGSYGRLRLALPGRDKRKADE
jgi:hypothetical protein